MGVSATWPRAVVYDFVCDKTVVDEGKPLSVLEYPAYTYTGELKEFSFFFYGTQRH